MDRLFAIYTRKSKMTEKGESIANQIELCKDYLRTHFNAENSRIIVYEDEGFSGGNLNRPDFSRMMADARNNKIQAIIVYRLDRISRNISDFAGLIEELSQLNVAFISIKEQFDTGSPMGRAMMYIASVFSQLERETIAERIRDNMHELAKTGRWLGGTSPTGYTSESVKSISINGKEKKACKLKLVPEEAEIVKTIFDLYTQTDSLTMTEVELISRGIKTKNDKFYTRFSIKAILQNPVYLIADQDAFDYFTKTKADLFSSKDEFDCKHGIMAYNRTDQQRGRATIMRSIEEWIVSVGEHPGLIPGKVWIKVQESLERNKSKAYHKPRSNQALLTGMLYCSCGSRMYPKLSNRKTADGKPIFTYVCKMKERSRGAICKVKNANGNTLDLAIVEQMKMLEGDTEHFIAQLEQSREYYTSDSGNYEERIAVLREEKLHVEKAVNGLIDSLIDMGSGTARESVARRIEEKETERQAIEARIGELEELSSRNVLNDMEFDLLCQLLSVFASSVDEMSIEQKRAAVRAIIRKVVWDGSNAHVILFGAKDGEIEYPAMDDININADEEDASELDHDVDNGEDYRLGKTNPLNASDKTHWGEDSK